MKDIKDIKNILMKYIQFLKMKIRRHKMPKGIKQIEKYQAGKMFENFYYHENNDDKIIELAVLFFNGKFYDITECEPLDLADFIQLERFKKLKSNDQ